MKKTVINTAVPTSKTELIASATFRNKGWVCESALRREASGQLIEILTRTRAANVSINRSTKGGTATVSRVDSTERRNTRRNITTAEAVQWCIARMIPESLRDAFTFAVKGGAL